MFNERNEPLDIPSALTALARDASTRCDITRIVHIAALVFEINRETGKMMEGYIAGTFGPDNIGMAEAGKTLTSIAQNAKQSEGPLQ